ncbi:MAG: hypothetical protein H0W67_02480 [Gemmatimonadales bacterium]|nr:hypothetical protein [Gemmatimonadales bacterium]
MPSLLPIHRRRHLAAFFGFALLSACPGPKPGPSAAGGSTAPDSAASNFAVSDSSPAFTNRVWKVGRSSGVERGMLYVFLGDGTLLIASAHGTPSLGHWTRSADTLTLIEEGIAHPAVMRRATADTFELTFAGRGAPLGITFVPASAP